MVTAAFPFDFQLRLLANAPGCYVPSIANIAREGNTSALFCAIITHESDAVERRSIDTERQPLRGTIV